jgi:hypothetical protein
VKRLPAKFDIKAPDGCCLILPSTDPFASEGIPNDVWKRISQVPHESVRGRVFLRHQPLSRLWLVR